VTAAKITTRGQSNKREIVKFFKQVSEKTGVNHFSGVTENSGFSKIKNYVENFSRGGGHRETAAAILYTLYLLPDGQSYVAKNQDKIYRRKVTFDIPNPSADTENSKNTVTGLIKEYGSFTSAMEDPKAQKRETLVYLAGIFKIDHAIDMPDAQILMILKEKAEEYQEIQRQVGEFGPLRGLSKEIDKLRFQAIAHLEELELDEAAEVLKKARTIAITMVEKPLALAADVARGEAALRLAMSDPLRAYQLMEISADSFRIMDEATACDMRADFAEQLLVHAKKFGGPALDYSISMILPSFSRVSVMNDPGRLCRYHTRLGESLNRKGAIERGQSGSRYLKLAIQSFERGLSYFQGKVQNEHCAYAKMGLGNSYLHTFHNGKRDNEGRLPYHRCLEDAHMHLSEALEFFQSFGDEVALAKAYNNVGLSLQYAGKRLEGDAGLRRLLSAKEKYLNATKIWNAVRDDDQWARTTNNLAFVEQAIGRKLIGVEKLSTLRNAAELHEAALEKRDLKTNPADYAQVLQGLASAYFELSQTSGNNHRSDDYVLALKHVRASKDAFRSVGMDVHVQANEFMLQRFEDNKPD
jgi:tetratricopeptide (TPR) repeat protein